jgi:DNA gyrase subunit A
VARKKSVVDQPPPPAAIIEQPIVYALESNYMPYAMSVIISRAIPEIDGFKPAHRKLLYTMYKMGLMTGNRLKSTDVVGQTMKLNPHGDQTIYETLVRLTRGNDALLHPFIDSKGNFGKQYSRDMAYAASRYTEVKLDAICAEIFKDIDKNSVDMIDSYDGRMKEPLVFPTTFPNLLVTPNQGIAVGMASQVCSFNLKEVCEATIHFIKDKNFQLSKYLLAPDFSSGGELILKSEEMDAIYATGRGSFKVRAKYRFDPKNSCIEILEIPYTTTIEFIIDKIASLVKANKIKEITDVRDETGLAGMKITLDIKRSADPDRLMHKLFAMTSLCDAFSCNFNFLIDGKPRTLGVTELLHEWVLFRISCIRRQIVFDIDKKSEKLHLLEGLSLILLDIDKAIAIVRNTEDDSQVIPNLMAGFSIDELQAEYVAEIKLRNLNKDYILSRTSEIDSLRKEIDDLKKLAQSDDLIKDLICSQLKEIIKKYGKPRRTEIITEEQVEDVPEDVFIDDYPIKLFLTEHGYFKKIPSSSLRTGYDQNIKDDDKMSQEIETTNKTDVIFFSDKCCVYKAKAYDLPDHKASSMGEYLQNLLGLEDGEKIVYMTVTLDYSGMLALVFQNGKAAKVPLESYATKGNRKKLVNAFSDKSPLVLMAKVDEDADLAILRNDGKFLVFSTSLLSQSTTKTTVGIQAMQLRKGTFISKAWLAADLELNIPKLFVADKLPAPGHFTTTTELASLKDQ